MSLSLYIKDIEISKSIKHINVKIIDKEDNTNRYIINYPKNVFDFAFLDSFIKNKEITLKYKNRKFKGGLISFKNYWDIFDSFGDILINYNDLSFNDILIFYKELYKKLEENQPSDINDYIINNTNYKTIIEFLKNRITKMKFKDIMILDMLLLEYYDSSKFQNYNVNTIFLLRTFTHFHNIMKNEKFIKIYTDKSLDYIIQNNIDFINIDKKVLFYILCFKNYYYTVYNVILLYSEEKNPLKYYIRNYDDSIENIFPKFKLFLTENKDFDIRKIFLDDDLKINKYYFDFNKYNINSDSFQKTFVLLCLMFYEKSNELNKIINDLEIEDLEILYIRFLLLHYNNLNYVLDKYIKEKIRRNKEFNVNDKAHNFFIKIREDDDLNINYNLTSKLFRYINYTDDDYEYHVLEEKINNIRRYNINDIRNCFEYIKNVNKNLSFEDAYNKIIDKYIKSHSEIKRFWFIDSFKEKISRSIIFLKNLNTKDRDIMINEEARRVSDFLKKYFIKRSDTNINFDIREYIENFYKLEIYFILLNEQRFISNILQDFLNCLKIFSVFKNSSNNELLTYLSFSTKDVKIIKDYDKSNNKLLSDLDMIHNDSKIDIILNN